MSFCHFFHSGHFHKATLQYFPILIDKIEKICEENGLRNDSIVMRMTGCPNGCARPYVAGMCDSGQQVLLSSYPYLRGCFCRQGSRHIFDAIGRWVLRAETQQTLQRLA